MSRSLSLLMIIAATAFIGSCALLADPEPPAVRYVDAENGNDSLDGLTPGSAWVSLEKVNAAAMPGDTVLFRRDQVFRGQLVPVSGTSRTPTRYGAYGTGDLPEIRGSVDLGRTTEWADSGDGIWTAQTVFQTDVGNLIFNDTAAFGMKKFSLSECMLPGDYYYDLGSGQLHLYSPSNPGTYYSTIEAAVRQHVVHQQGVSWVVYEDLSVRFGAAHGFGGGSTSNITIRNCEISYIGGGDLDMDGSNVRFGNGIEFWGSAHDHLVEGNRIWEIYDSGLSNQNHTNAVDQYNIIYRNNIVWNCGMSSFEYWNRPANSATWNIVFEHNTATGAGEGWGAPPQRPDPVGVHVLLPFSDAAAHDLVIRNNIFSGGNLSMYMVHGSQWETALTLDGNIYYRAIGDIIQVENPVLSFTGSQMPEWQIQSGKDASSLAADPLLADPANGDFTLTSVSPAIDAGVASTTPWDFDGTERPQGTAPDIGAYEW